MQSWEEPSEDGHHDGDGRHDEQVGDEKQEDALGHGLDSLKRRGGDEPSRTAEGSMDTCFLRVGQIGGRSFPIGQIWYSKRFLVLWLSMDAAVENALIQARNLEYRFPSGTDALSGVDFSLSAGEFVSLVGHPVAANPPCCA